MNDRHLLHELKIMAQAVVAMEQGLKRIDMLELEMLAIKAGFQKQKQIVCNSICVLLGNVGAYSGFEYLFKDSDNTTTVLEPIKSNKNSEV